MVKEKLTVKSRTVTVAAAASEAKSVRFVDTEKHGYRVMEMKVLVFTSSAALS